MHSQASPRPAVQALLPAHSTALAALLRCRLRPLLLYHYLLLCPGALASASLPFTQAAHCSGAPGCFGVRAMMPLCT